MKIVLVRQGEKYGPEYVEALIDQLEGREVVTLTDVEDTPGEVRKLKYNLPGWWSKLELFAPDNEPLRPYLYIDLDSIIINPDRLIDYHNGYKFTMVTDFMNWRGMLNSSVMWIPANSPRVSYVWQKFISAKDAYMANHKGDGDQGFLWRMAEDKWQCGSPSGIMSYKEHCRDRPKGNIVTFHGKPKMPDVTEGWVYEKWRNYAC